MKQFFAAMVLIVMIGCNDAATDGDAKTDTTTMPVDPNVNADTSTHINRMDGTVPADTARRNDTLQRRQ